MDSLCWLETHFSGETAVSTEPRERGALLLFVGGNGAGADGQRRPAAASRRRLRRQRRLRFQRLGFDRFLVFICLLVFFVCLQIRLLRRKSYWLVWMFHELDGGFGTRTGFQNRCPL